VDLVGALDEDTPVAPDCVGGVALDDSVRVAGGGASVMIRSPMLDLASEC